jgi:hypothetical protein
MLVYVFMINFITEKSNNTADYLLPPSALQTVERHKVGLFFHR